MALKGVKQTLEHIRKRTAHRKGKPVSAKIAEQLRLIGYKKGQVSPRKGVLVSEDARLKMRMAKLGRPSNCRWTKEMRQAVSQRLTGKPQPWHKGDKSRFWKGGIYPLNLKLRKSIQYRIWRKAVFERDNYTCVWCGDNKGGNLEADHIKPFAKFPCLRFVVENGRTLCKLCHRKTNTYGNKSKINV